MSTGTQVHYEAEKPGPCSITHIFNTIINQRYAPIYFALTFTIFKYRLQSDIESDIREDVEGDFVRVKIFYHNIGKESSVSKASGTTSRNTNSENRQQGVRERQKTTGQEELDNMICTQRN